MSGFVDECRREWRRLGVPDPIANEMAFDLAADIEAAEADGGSAEDVLGNSLFDARSFAAAWARARGVAPSPERADTVVPLPERRRPELLPAVLLAVVVTGLLAVFATVVLVVGGRSSSVARGINSLPASSRVFGPGGVVRHFAVFDLGPSFASRSALPVMLAALVLFVVGVIVVGLAVHYWSPDTHRALKRRLW